MGDAVLAHLASTVAPGVDVLFLDTGYHFAETIGTRDAVEATLPVNLLSIEPKQTVAEQDAAYGKDLFNRDPDLCCALRKVAPLNEAMQGYDAWATGLRRDETHNRVIAPVIGWDDKKRKVKVSPLARWTGEDVDALHRRERRAGQPAAVRRLPVDRLLAVHAPRGARRGPAQRALGRHRQDRVRDPRMNPIRWSSPSRPHPNPPDDNDVGHEASSTKGSPLMTAPALVALAHGSRDPRSAATIKALVDEVRTMRPDLRIEPAFLDLSKPSFGTVVDKLVRAGFDEIVVVPLLLTEAYHAKVDVPEAIAEATARHENLRIRATHVLGLESVFLEVLDRRLRTALKDARVRELDALVLAAAGSSDALANQAVARLARLWGAKHKLPTVAAYASAAPPATGEAVRQFRAEGRRHIAVGSLFLAPGTLPDRAAELALEAGAVAVSAPLGADPEVARTVLARYAVGAVELVPV